MPVPLTFPVHFLSMFLAPDPGFFYRGNRATDWKSSLHYHFSTIENIGLTTIECILLTLTIFLFHTIYPQQKNLFSYLSADCSTLPDPCRYNQRYFSQTVGELIVYNSTGYSATGIRSGKILNLFSDTIMRWAGSEQTCLDLRLKSPDNLINEYPYLIKYDEKNYSDNGKYQ